MLPTMKHLIREDRMRLHWMILWWVDREKMIEVLWCGDRTIRREIQKWSINGIYYPQKWQEYIDQWRRKNAQWRTKPLKDNWHLEILKSNLEPWYSSPDSIAGRMKLEWKEFVCTKTIYNYIWLYDWWLRKLLTYKKQYKKRHSRKWKRPLWYRHISTRSQEAEKRLEVWHMEIDLVMSKGNKAWLLTMVDRKSRYWLIAKVYTKHIKEINRVLRNKLRKEEIIKKLKTITSDNGHEFFWLRKLEKKLWFEQYYADPYNSWQRWTNEQFNWQLRKLFPKWTIFNTIPTKTIQNMQIKLNRKPRKILWYRTPEEVFNTY